MGPSASKHVLKAKALIAALHDTFIDRTASRSTLTIDAHQMETIADVEDALDASHTQFSQNASSSVAPVSALAESCNRDSEFKKCEDEEPAAKTAVVAQAMQDASQSETLIEEISLASDDFDPRRRCRECGTPYFWFSQPNEYEHPLMASGMAIPSCLCHLQADAHVATVTDPKLHEAVESDSANTVEYTSNSRIIFEAQEEHCSPLRVSSVFRPSTTPSQRPLRRPFESAHSS